MSEYTMLEVGQAVDELRKSVESGTMTEEKSAKIDVILDSYETKNQEIVKANQQIIAQEESIKSFKLELEEKGVEAGKIREQVDQLEISLAKSISGPANVNYRDTEEFKAFNSYIVEGEDRISAEHKAELRTDSATEGGVLVVPEMEDMILKKIVFAKLLQRALWFQSELVSRRQITKVRLKSVRLARALTEVRRLPHSD